MSIAPLERTDLTLIEELDWDHEPACEHHAHERGWFGHKGPAWALIERLHCPGCGHRPNPGVLYLCKGAWEAWTGTYPCEECRHENTREQVWRFIALVRP